MQIRQPAWWQLYLLLALFAAPLLGEYADPLPRIPAEAVALTLLALFIAAIALWLALNRRALQRSPVPEDELRATLTVKIYENGRLASPAAKLGNAVASSPRTGARVSQALMPPEPGDGSRSN